jgi:hypothetical protein
VVNFGNYFNVQVSCKNCRRLMPLCPPAAIISVCAYRKADKLWEKRVS